MTKEEFKAARKRLGHTQSALSKLLGVSLRAVQTWESGERNITTPIVLAMNGFLDALEPKYEHSAQEVKVEEPFTHDFRENTNGNKFEALPNGRFKLTVDLIPVKAYARYISEVNDVEFLDGYEQVDFIVDRYARGNYKGFEVKGDSMDYDGRDHTPDKAIALGRELNRAKWPEGFRESQYGWIIVTNNNIVFKDITDQDMVNGIITCHSRNPSIEYSDFKLSLDEDVRQIFKVIKRQF